MSADHHDFVGAFATADLGDDVGRVGVGKELRVHFQPDAHFRAPVLHALEALGVLDRD